MSSSDRPMQGKTAFVTGATSGIGLETARSLARMGARVVVGARDATRGRAVVEGLTGGSGSAELLEIDVASFGSIRRAVERLSALHPRLDVLVNNAGVVLRKRRMTADGHEVTWQTNFLGPFLLTRLLLPTLKEAPKPRVVNVSSEAHKAGKIPWDDLELTQGYRGLRAYAQSKLALVLFTRELARREPAIAVNAVHPGTIWTGIWRPAPRLIQSLLRLFLPSAEKGARPLVRLGSAPELDTVSGRYFDKMREATPAPAAANDADAACLWEAAEKATGEI